MIKVLITEEHKEKAQKLAEEIGSLNNSIRSGKGNFIGCLGEVIASEKLGYDHDNTYDYDLSTIREDKKVTFDVKTKQRTVSPRDDYWATVADYNTKQKCDYYLFASSVNLEYMYLIGYISKSDFYEKACFFNKGDLDPLGPKGKNWKFRASCYNLKYKDLKQL